MFILAIDMLHLKTIKQMNYTKVSKSYISLIRKTLNRLNLLNDFEFEFLKSLTKSRPGKYYHTALLSNKQYKIYQSLKDRYNQLDMYEIYIDWFEFNGIELDDFEIGYLETYKGEYERTENLNNFIHQTLNK